MRINLSASLTASLAVASFLVTSCIFDPAAINALAAEDSSPESQAKESKNENPKVEIIPLNAQENDLVERRLFGGQLPPVQQIERCAPLLQLSSLVIDYPAINISESRQDPNSRNQFTIDKYAYNKLSETLQQLGIKIEPASPAAIKIHGAISGAQNELSLIVLDDLAIERLPNRRYRTIIFSTTESEGTPEQMVDRLCLKFAGCWNYANNKPASEAVNSGNLQTLHDPAFPHVRTKIVKGTPTFMTDIEFLGASNSFGQSLKIEKRIREEAKKNNSQLLNNFPRMKMQDRFRNAKLLSETQFFTGMNADQLVETLGMPDLILDTSENVTVSEKKAPESKRKIHGPEKKFSSKSKLTKWLMQEFSRAQLTYECGTKKPRPKMVIDIRNFKVTGTSLVNF